MRINILLDSDKVITFHRWLSWKKSLDATYPVDMTTRELVYKFLREFIDSEVRIMRKEMDKEGISWRVT